MQAVILAGGKGTRLRERLGGLPKPLVDVDGKPLLDRQLALLEQQGFTEALLLIGHAGSHLVAHCAARPASALHVECIDDGEPRGTAGATLAVLERLAPEFLVLYGDTLLDVDLGRFRQHHARFPEAAATLFVHPNDHPFDSDLVALDEHCAIGAFHPYPHDPEQFYPNLVSAALYWVRRESLRPWRHAAGPLDFGRDLFPALLQAGSRLIGYVSPEYTKDVGTPARLDEACSDLRSGKMARARLDQPQPLVFLDRDGTLNREVHSLKKVADLELLAGVAAAIRRFNRSGHRCCLVTNQPVIARGECSLQDLRAIHDKLETLLGREGAYLDRLYFCPHHPERGFAGERPELKGECDCRKPKTGMIERALRELHGDRSRTWLIGDSSVDTETARRAGLKSVLVETGHAGLDYRTWATPDAIVPDLAAAAAFILDEYPRLLRYCERLAREVKPGGLVLIGGTARCGKSTFASTLRDACAARGLRAVILPIDRWLSDEEHASSVRQRHALPTLQALVERLADAERRPTTLTVPGYHKVQHRSVAAVDSLSVAAADIVLVEGALALALDTPAAATQARIHLDIEGEERKRRVLRDYGLRDYCAVEAEALYAAREIEEFALIERLARGASRICLADIYRDRKA